MKLEQLFKLGGMVIEGHTPSQVFVPRGSYGIIYEDLGNGIYQDIKVIPLSTGKAVQIKEYDEHYIGERK